MTHTKTPWIINRALGNTAICTSPDDEHAIINCWPDDAPTTGEEAIANTLHIVKCVNAHDALVDALKALYLDRCTTQDGLVVIQASDDLGLSAYKALKLAGAE